MTRFSLFALLILTWPTLGGADESLTFLGKLARDPQKTQVVLRELTERRDLTLLSVLEAMQGQQDLAKNLYLSLAQTIADRDTTAAVEVCKQFLQQRSQDPTARYWAFTYVTTYLPSLREKLLESMTDDPCPELRYEAIGLQMERLSSAGSSGETGPTASDRVAAYQELLQLARLPEQVQQIASKLEELGTKVNLLQHFGFIANWSTVGPFDNVGQAGFNVSYPPEQDYVSKKLLDGLDSLAYDGKEKGLKWRSLTTDKSDGKVDLNTPYSNAKGAIVYAFSQFDAGQDRQAEIRVGSTNAIKVWFNGQLVIDREVYHAGDQIDQYIAPIQLKAGKNLILLKVCQIEQTEQLAQDWFFQVRLSDSTGLAVTPSVASK